MKRIWTIVFIFVFLLLVVMFVTPKGSDENVDFGVYSLIPPLVAILLAFLTKQVILSLFIGVFFGATMVYDGNIFYGFLRTLDKYMLGSVADSWNAGILIFTLTIGGMVGVISKMGGTQAIAEVLAKKVKNSRSAQLSTWLMGLFVFFDDYSNTLIVGPTMRPLTDKMTISREKLSYIVDSTAAPVTGMALISTWVGYELGLINESFKNLGIEVNSYDVFVKSIPYRFYDIFALVMVFLIAWLMRDFGPMYKAEKRARLMGKVLADGATPLAATNNEIPNIKEADKLRVSNAVVPILTLVIVGFVGLWYSGGGTEQPFTFEGVRKAFGDSDASVALIWASALASMVAIVMAISQKILGLNEAIEAWVDGAKSLVITAVILTLAWSLGTVTSDVGTADYLVKIVTDTLPVMLLPFLVFIISSVVSFATGTSWGTMAIMIPLAIPLASAYTGGSIDGILLGTLGAVLAGSIFGDHSSPISDTTILSSMASASDHIDHVKTQIPYALTTAIVASAVGYIPIGLGMSPFISLVLGIVIIWAIIRFYGKSTNIDDLRKLEENID
ncbi:sodium:proton antiporter [Vulcanibacillus modesticaldus]|uniref:Sodium:proton antiporter n=1 Tax=Vulcanibacillus modesticaldus TaxID=337097 RepID=A0A1D2YTX5_9BACI|nr:Na+/H+ antiporter NhaC family protein [Vulcanibacillus modesticaldus]OEF99095.1 sodium:proton antiporter [Vulcanibacillus modesticaldus]